MIPLLVALTLFNSVALVYLIGVVSKRNYAPPQDERALPTPAQTTLPSGDVPDALIAPAPQSLTPPKAEDELAPEEVAKIAMQVRPAGTIKEWYNLEVYNGTIWPLKEMIVTFTASKDGKEVLSRNYKIDGVYTQKAKPLTSFAERNFTAFALEEGQTMAVRVVSARKKMPAA